MLRIDTALLRRLIQTLGSRRPKDFELLHPLGVCIARALTLSALPTAAPGASLARREMGNGWIWVRLPAFLDGDVVVDISLGFNGEQLEHIDLCDANLKYGAGWEDGSEQQERLRADSIGAWLAGKGYAPGRYSWGEVWAGYDPKSGSGSAAVRLRPRA